MNTKISTFVMAILLPAAAGAAVLRDPMNHLPLSGRVMAVPSVSHFLDGASSDARFYFDADGEDMTDPLWIISNEDLPPDMMAQREGGPMRGRGGRPFPPFGGPGGRGPGPRPGPMMSPQLMEKLRDLPPEEQEKVLKNNERFQELPKKMQDQMIDRLHSFQALPPEQREMIQKRFDAFNKFTPEDRQKMRQFFSERWQKLPEERHRALLNEFRKMRRMSPEEGEKYLASPDVASRLNADELDVLKQLRKFAPPPLPPGMMPPPPPDFHSEGAEPRP
jgi:hypothetical protein